MARTILLLFATASASWAQPVELPSTSDERNLAELSIEELMNETITSVSKREQRLGDAAAAIFVLSHDDLRRSGATSIAEALRLVPGMVVSSVNARQWAISVRGFNSVYANKLLVLVDGRPVYSPIFAGVEWDLQQTMLEDVDRIEVIRGPGATLWGANAVNGVINVVTRSAMATQGGILYGGGGNAHRVISGLRYGGRIGDKAYYRAFGSYQINANGHQPDGRPGADGWKGRHGGFRLDHDPRPDTHLTWQADSTGLSWDRHGSSASNFNTLGRWTRTSSKRSSVEVQAVYDHTYRDDASASRNATDAFDLTGHQTFGWGERNDLIWGLRVRLINSTSEDNSPSVDVRQGRHRLHLFSALLQDEWRLVPDRLTLTAGVKVEHNDFTGFEVQPSFRSVFKPTESQTLWAAVSRAVRTPDVLEGRDLLAVPVGAPILGPDGALYLPTIVGNSDLAAEVLWAYELGYRIQAASPVSLDLAVFYNDYDHLISGAEPERFVPGSPFGTAEVPWSNLLSATTYGGEASLSLSPTAGWRLTTSYSLLLAKTEGPAAASRELLPPPPKHQLVLRSSHDLAARASLDAQLRYVDHIPAVDRYVTADLRLSYRVSDRLELSLAGQNLLDGQHLEQTPLQSTVTVEAPRGFYVKIVRRF